MAREGFMAHVEDMETEHQEIPHLTNHDIDPFSASQGSIPIENTWAVGMHINPPGDLAFALGFSISSMISNQQANLGSRRVRVNQGSSISMAGHMASMLFKGVFLGASSAQNVSA